MPPRENPRINKSLDSVHASGPLGRAHCVIHGNSNYKQTGLLQAYAAYSLLQQPPQRVGFASGCQAFGHRELLGVLRSFGLVSEPRAHRRRAEPRMRLVDYLDKGASLGPGRALPDHRRRRPARTPRSRTHQPPGRRGARRAGASRPGDKVAILSANDPIAFTCVFGISRAGAVWCPINPRNEAAENRELLDLFDCSALIFQPRSRPWSTQIRDDLPQVHDAGLPRRRPRLGLVLGRVPRAPTSPSPTPPEPVDDVAMIVGTGGTTGRPKGVMLTEPQPRDDDRAHADGLPVRGPAGLPRARAADPRRRRALLPGAGPRRRGRDHADPRRRRLPRPRRAATASPTPSCRRR